MIYFITFRGGLQGVFCKLGASKTNVSPFMMGLMIFAGDVLF